MEIKNYEYGIDKEHCKHGLSVSVNSCRRCLFETLCHLEHTKENQNLDSNNN